MTLLKSASLRLTASLAFGLLTLASPPLGKAQQLPSYATAEQTIRGRIRSIDGQYHITVRDNKGYLDSVALHQRTLINPPGLVLAPRMSVTIFGYNAGSVFVANEIDTPYKNIEPQSSANGDTTLYYAPSYNVVTTAYPAYTYGWPYWGSPFYSPFVYGWSAWGYPAYRPYYYGSYWGYSGYRPYYPYRWGGYYGYSYVRR
jgi:hypothetical protein